MKVDKITAGEYSLKFGRIISVEEDVENLWEEIVKADIGAVLVVEPDKERKETLDVLHSRIQLGINQLRRDSDENIKLRIAKNRDYNHVFITKKKPE